MERLKWNIPPTTEISYDIDSFPTLEGLPHVLQSSIMPVVVHKPATGEVRPLGTCFCISSCGLVVTADHVMLEALDIMGIEKKPLVGDPGRTRIPAGLDDWRLAVLYWSKIMPVGSEKKTQGGLITVLKVWRRPEADLCVMFLQMMVHKRTGESIYMPALPVSPGIPEEGQVCTGFGYHSSVWERIQKGDVVLSM